MREHELNKNLENDTAAVHVVSVRAGPLFGRGFPHGAP